MGNPASSSKREEGGAPTLSVRIRYATGAMNARVVEVPWERGMTVISAVKRARRIDPLFRVDPRRLARVVGNRRLRLRDLLQPGDLLRLNNPIRPYL